MEQSKLCNQYSWDEVDHILISLDLTFYPNFAKLREEIERFTGSDGNMALATIELGLNHRWIVGDIDGTFWIVIAPNISDSDWKNYLESIDFREKIKYVFNHPSRRFLTSGEMIRLIQLKVLDAKRRKSDSDMHLIRGKTNETFWRMIDDGTLRRAADRGVELASNQEVGTQ